MLVETEGTGQPRERGQGGRKLSPSFTSYETLMAQVQERVALANAHKLQAAKDAAGAAAAAGVAGLGLEAVAEGGSGRGSRAARTPTLVQDRGHDSRGAAAEAESDDSDSPSAPPSVDELDWESQVGGRAGTSSSPYYPIPDTDATPPVTLHAHHTHRMKISCAPRESRPSSLGGQAPR
jgi:hypothetical protein